MADLPTSRERIQLRFAARAIPPDTLLHAAPNRKPIGIARDWIPVLEEHRKRRGWTEVTLGTELAPRVWVRADRISHLR